MHVPGATQAHRITRFLCVFGLTLSASPFAPGHAAETDQYLVWGVELEDSGPAVNAWLNDEFRDFLERVHLSERLHDSTAEELTIRFLRRRVFRVRPIADINELYNSGKLDRYPPDDVNFFEYQRMSIYRGPAFPYILFMARTIRVGDIYLGIDKLSHLFGYGRRYLKDYLRLESEGLSHDSIVENLVESGLKKEFRFTGGAVNGIVSLSDLEANYQGLRFALDMARGDDAVLQKRDGQWVQTRPIDIVPYMTPYMDESYYHSYYLAQRKEAVEQVLESEYRDRYEADAVQKRFDRYDEYEPSLNVRILNRFFDVDPGEPAAAQAREKTAGQTGGADAAGG